MARIAPDIPELQHVPEAARPLVYTRALMHALRSPGTLLPAFLALVVMSGAGLALGSSTHGVAGGILGSALGIAAAAYFFYQVLLPWRARLAIPDVQRHIDAAAVERIGQAADDLSRMLAAYKEREAETTQRRQANRPPRLP